MEKREKYLKMSVLKHTFFKVIKYGKNLKIIRVIIEVAGEAPGELQF